MKLIPALALLKHKRTKIIATIGPASSSEKSIRLLIEKGVNVFRLNMSHGEHAGHEINFHRIRKIAEEMDEHVAILADLCGPKIRTGTFKNGPIDLIEGTNVIVTMREVEGEAGLICSQYKNLAQDVRVGNRIFLADGVMELKVVLVEGDEVHCKVIQGGILSDHKGINLPDASVSAPSMTEKDYKDAAFALSLGVDFFALSFVRHVEDVVALRQWLTEQGATTSIISKIERPEALDDACAIIEASDAIMIARGDLGVELPPEQVPVAQQMLIDEARRLHKPVIVATQILESMIENSRPTRAEATDVFHSVSAGADAVMLSGETAVGKHPVAAVEIMSRLIFNAEAYLWQNGAFASTSLAQDNQRDVLLFGDAVARSTALLSRDLMVHGIVVLSSTGASTTAVSSARPEAPILAAATDATICRKMNLLWGVIPVLVTDNDMLDPIALAKHAAEKYKLAQKGDSILLIQGFNHDEELSHPSITAFKV